jgi:hypothetical protein
MNYLFVKEENQVNVTSKEIFEELCRKDYIKRDTKLYDISNCEVVSVQDIHDFREIWENIHREAEVVSFWKGIQEEDKELYSDPQLPSEKVLFEKPKKNPKGIIIGISLILFVLVLLVGVVTFSPSFNNPINNEPLAIETLSYITGQFQQFEKWDDWEKSTEGLEEYYNFIKSTELLYESLEKDIENTKLYVFDEKMEDILSGEVYKDMKEFHILEDELQNYILDFTILEREIEDKLDRYLQNLLDEKLQEGFKEKFLLEVKPLIYDSLDTRMEKHRLERFKMDKLSEILDFMKNNRYRFVVLRTGLRFFFDNDKDIYIRHLNEFYGLD